MEDMSTIARPYAQAALSQADSEGKLAEWSDMLSFLADAVRDPTMAGVIANPRVDAEKLTELMLGVADGRLSDTGANFVRLLVAKDRTAALPEISAQFETRRAELEGRRHVDIVSAFELDAAQQDKLAAAVARRLGREVDIAVTVDEALIGGVIIRAGDLVIDASVRGRLAQLGTALGGAAA
tara:strand:+ start:4341 stop:4886 length:546 start_codon:yes stop_codon:yes gene_type:complete